MMGWDDSRFSVRDWGGTTTHTPQPVVVVSAKELTPKRKKFHVKEWRP